MKFDRFLWKALMNMVRPVLIACFALAYLLTVIAFGERNDRLGITIAIVMIAIPILALALFIANGDAKHARRRDGIADDGGFDPDDH